jgi:serine protease Do
MAKALKLPGKGGALIAAVQPDSPAAKAGLRPGDVVRAVDGRRIETPRELAFGIAAIKPGSTAKLEVLRGGETRQVSVSVADMPGEQRADATGAGEEGEQRVRLGLSLAPLSEELTERMDLPKDTRGTVIAGVQPGSPAARAGLRPGDIITDIAGTAVSEPADVQRAVRAAEKDPALALRVMRNGRAMFIAVPLTDAAGAGQG